MKKLIIASEQWWIIIIITIKKTWIVKADYELPIGEKSKFEAGARYDFKMKQHYWKSLMM